MMNGDNMKKFLALTVILIISITAFSKTYTRNNTDFEWNYSFNPSNLEKVKVTGNVDGDTIKVNYQGKTESIRMIGVDTPETVHPSKPVEYFGKEASNFTKSMCPVGSEVYLTFDWDKRDKYDRILAYVWYQQDGKWVLHNLNLIANGYGHAYTVYAFDSNYMKIFSNAERVARENSVGLWGDSTLAPPQTTQTSSKTVYITKTGKKYHRDGCRYLSKSKIPILLNDAIARGYTPCSVCNP